MCREPRRIPGRVREDIRGEGSPGGYPRGESRPGDAEEAARALGDEVAIAANGAQPGVTERAAEDPVKVSRGTVLAPANAGGGGALEFQGSGGGSRAWRVISVKTGGGKTYARG